MHDPDRPLLIPRPRRDNAAATTALLRATPFAVLAGAVAYLEWAGLGLVFGVLAALLAFAGSLLVISGGAALVAHLAARAGASFLLPSGRGTPAAPDFSLEKSLLARGRTDEALAGLRGRLIAEPENAALCIFAADAYAGAGDPRRAEALFRRARQVPALAAGQELYATNRLIDLYLGPLNEPARAADELRRLVERHPGTPEARHAEQVIGSLAGAGPRLPARGNP